MARTYRTFLEGVMYRSFTQTVSYSFPKGLRKQTKHVIIVGLRPKMQAYIFISDKVYVPCLQFSLSKG
jgi:hypothetical protein